MESTDLSKRDAWETEVVEYIQDKLDLPYGDASAIIEGQPFTVAQSWGLGLSAGDAAGKIISAATKEQ